MSRCAILICVLACLALAISCDEGDEDDDCPCDAGADGDTDTDADADSDTDGVNCAETWASFEGVIEHAGALTEADIVTIKAYEGTQGQGCGYGATAGLYLHDVLAGDYEIEPTYNIHTCDACIVLGVSCSLPNPASCITFFVATEGFLDLVMIVEDEPWDNWFEFVAEDLVLTEHTVDWESGEASPVTYGETMCIENWHMATELINWN